MRLRLSYHILFVLYFIIQINDVGSEAMTDEGLLALQMKVEELIEKIITYLQDYYKDIKSELKCIPDFISTNLIELIKEAVDCVHNNEKNFNENSGTMKNRSKKFLECFKNAKKDVKDMMKSVNTTIDYCPVNITEKTYQINVSTIFTKTFRINIRNGVEILKKEIELEKGSKHCFDHSMDVEYDSEEGWEGAEIDAEAQTEDLEKTTVNPGKTENLEDQKAKNATASTTTAAAADAAASTTTEAAAASTTTTTTTEAAAASTTTTTTTTTTEAAAASTTTTTTTEAAAASATTSAATTTTTTTASPETLKNSGDSKVATEGNPDIAKKENQDGSDADTEKVEHGALEEENPLEEDLDLGDLTRRSGRPIGGLNEEPKTSDTENLSDTAIL